MLRPTVFRPSLRAALALGACAAALAACADVTSPTSAAPAASSETAAEWPAEDASLSPEVLSALAGTRAATARYHDVDRAVADGYAPTGGCVAVPGLGGMGVHYVNVPLLLDPTLDPERPEVLVYEPQKNGRMRLVATEWLAFAAAYPNGAPSLFGQTLENGPPLPGPGGAPVPSYALHAWIWKHNPSGVFAAFNPRVSCQYAPAPAAAAATAHAHAH